MESQSQWYHVLAMQNPLPPFDVFDTTNDYDCHPAGSHDQAHMTQQQQNNGQPHPQVFDSQALGDSITTTTAMPGHHTPMNPFGDTTTKDYLCGTEVNTPLYSTFHSTMTTTLGDADYLPSGTEDNIFMTQQQSRRDTSKLFPAQAVRGSMPFQPQGVGGSTTATAQTFHPQAVGVSPAGTEDNIYMTQQQNNDRNTPLQTPTMGVSGSGIQPTLQNIVVTVNLGCKLDLKLIIQKARNAEYNPKRFSAVIMRIREPRTTAMIFSTGKMVCTGATSEEQSRLAARKFARAVQKLGFPAKFLDFKIQNMVGSCDVKFPVRLEKLFVKHQQFSQYEPESFPGLVYKMMDPRINLLIFMSGKVVLTGAKAKEEINQAFENIYPILKSLEKSEYRHETNSKQVQ